MKFTLSLLLAGVFFVGTAYAPTKRAAAPEKTLDQKYADALPLVNAAKWPTSGDHEKPNVANKVSVVIAADCLPGNKQRKSYSNYLNKCVQEA
jgi:hypothetical protein